MSEKLKKYKIKPTSKQMEILRESWKCKIGIENEFYKELEMEEDWMSKKTGIKGLEFFWCDNEIVGIGTAGRDMKLLQREQLEPKES